MTGEELKRLIKQSLRRQGFRITSSGIEPPLDSDKDTIRRLHAMATQHCLEESSPALRSAENRLLGQIAHGEQVDPAKFDPCLIEVQPKTEEELLFRYATLHWSIPVSSGYGRRLRFIVKDRSNGKLVGVIGLCDPVISLGGRDRWVGWDSTQRLQNLRHVMDAFVLGAVPPYSQLLCGKLVALLATCDLVREAFYRKYAGSESRISGRKFDGRLALITTMSALGRSSVYNRLKFGTNLVYESVGFSQGTGEFHFSNGLYSSIAAYATRYCEPTYRSQQWGNGFRNRREVIRKCLKKIHLGVSWSHHGIAREVFVCPLAVNTQAFLRGENQRLRWFRRDCAELTEWFKDRWLIPRATRDDSFKAFQPEDYRLWDTAQELQ